MLAVVALTLIQSSTVDAVVQKNLDKGLLGVGVAVVKDGKLLHLKTYGKGATAKNDGHYRLASITKQFTAGVVVKLVREKKLSYEDTLGKLMPETPAAWHPVTIRHLLTHTSGIPSYTESLKFMGVAKKPTTPDGIWQLTKGDKMDFEPGSKFKYNNTAYCLLGSIIERTTKRDYYSALNTYLLKPAGMRSTGPEKKFKFVPSFDDDGSPSFPLNMDWPYAAGALVSTLGDMVKWDLALRGNKLFSEAEKQLMFNPDPLAKKQGQDYGFGWNTTYADGKPYSHWHTGGIPGFSNIIERTTNGVTVIMLANHEFTSIAGLRTEIRDAFDPMPKPAPILDPKPEVTAKHKQLLEDLFAGKCDESKFSGEFLKKVPPAVLLSTSKDLLKLGPLKEFVLIKSNGDSDTRRSYRVVLGTTPLTLSIAEENGVIIGMVIR